MKEGDLYICTLGAKHNGYLFIDLVSCGAQTVTHRGRRVSCIEEREFLGPFA